MTGPLKRLDAAGLAARRSDFAALLSACVHAGGSVGFVLPFDDAAAAAFWRDAVEPSVAAGRRLIWAVEAQGDLLGTVQLDLAGPPNQPHRAEVSKLLVHPAQRRRGIGRALMGALEAEARGRGRSLLTLDTRTGDVGEPLYRALGFETAGVIPGYCLDPVTQALDGTTFMYKTLT